MTQSMEAAYVSVFSVDLVISCATLCRGGAGIVITLGVCVTNALMDVDQTW